VVEGTGGEVMGVSNQITLSSFPEQSDFLGKQVAVCFHYDTSQQIDGVIVRDDTEEPGVCIIRLSDGRHVLSTECQYRIC